MIDYYPQDIAQIADWKTALVLLRKRSVGLSKVLDSGADFRPDTHVERPMEVFSRNRGQWTPSLLPPSASLPLAAVSKRGAYKFV